MSNFHRQLWKQKPQVWGPVDTVRFALRDRLEKLNIAWEDLYLALPLWSPGTSVDYSSKRVDFSGSATFRDNKLTFSANKIVSGALPANQTSVTQLSWASVSSFVSYGKIFVKGFGSNGSWPSPWLCYGISLSTSGNALSFQVSTTPTTLSLNTVSNAYLYNVPFFAAMSYGGADLHCIVNNELKLNTNIPGALTTSTGPYFLGANGINAEYHYGNQDQHLVFNAVLSDDQIFAFYDNPYQLWQPKARTLYSIPKSTVITCEISLPSGSYTASSTIEITSDTPGSTIYYTMNGVDPTTADSVYSTPLEMFTGTLKAYAVADGHDDSAIVSATYTLVYQVLESFSMDIYALGETSSDNMLDIALAGEIAFNAPMDISALLQSIDNALLDVDAVQLVSKDNKLDLFAGLQFVIDTPLNISVAAEQFKNTFLDIMIANGTITRDMGIDINIGDGNKTQNMSMSIMAVSTKPEYKSIYAIHLNSAIREII